MGKTVSGIPVFADIPGPAGLFTLAANRIRKNNKACPASEDGTVSVLGSRRGAAGRHRRPRGG